jgi:hypothetical protein
LTASKESGRRRGARPRGGVDEEDLAADDAMACGPSRWVSLDFVQSGLHSRCFRGKGIPTPRSAQSVAPSEKKFNSGESLRGARREDDDVVAPRPRAYPRRNRGRG